MAQILKGMRSSRVLINQYVRSPVPFMFEKTSPQNKHSSPENGGPLEKEIPNLETKKFPGSMLNLGDVL